MAYSGPTFVGLSTAGGNAASFNINFSSSGRAAGDMLLIGVETANQAIAAPSGFSQTPGADNPQGQGTAGQSSAVRGTVFEKQSNGTETTVAIADSGNHQYAVGLVVRPSGGASAVEVCALAGGFVPFGGSTSGRVVGGVTAPSDNCLIVTFAFIDLDAATVGWNDVIGGGAANVTERWDNGTSAGTGGGLAIWTGEQETAASVPDLVVNGTNVTGFAWITLAIRNVAGGSEEYASASLSGTGTASVSSRAAMRSSAAPSGAGTASAIARRVTYASAAMSASGAIAAKAGRYTSVSATLGANSSVSPASRIARSAAANLSGSATATASVRAERVSSAAFTAAGAVQSTARRTTMATASLAGAGSASVIARRITHANLLGEAKGSASASVIVFKPASASLAGAGSMSVSTRARLNLSTSLVGEGSLTASVQGGGSASASLSGAGALIVALKVQRRSMASLSAAGSTQAIGRRLTSASASLSAQGALSAAIGADNEAVAVSLVGSGTLTASCRVERRASAVLSGAGAMAVLARIEARSSAALAGAGALIAFAYDANAPLPPPARQAKTPARDVSATTDIGNSEAVTRIGERQVTTMKGRRAA